MKSILVIDDQKNTLTKLRTLINCQIHDCRIFTCLTGKGMETAREQQPDIILLDIIMSEMDDFEVCKRLKTDDSTNHIPLIMLTTNQTDSVSRAKAQDLGADAFLSKPVDAIELSAQIKAMFRMKEAEDNLRAEKVKFEQLVFERTNELMLSEEKYKTLVEFTNIIPWRFNIKKDKFTYFEKQAEKILGYPVESWTDMESWAKRIHVDDRKKSVEYCLKYTEKCEDHEFEYRCIGASGEIIWIKDIVSVRTNEKGDPKELIGYMLDITERKLAEAEFVKLKAGVEQSANTIVITDINGSIEYINPKFTELTEYTEKESLGKNPRFLNAGTQGSEYYTEMWRTISNGKSWKGEFHNKKKSGGLFWEQVTITPIKDKNGKTTNYLAVKEDITAKREAEQALKESEIKYRAIFENVQDAFYEVTLEGIVLEISPSLKNLSKGQYERTDLIGRHLSELYANYSDRELFIKELQIKGSVNDYEIDLKNRDGSIIPCSISSRIQFDASGNPEKIIGSLREIGQRKQAEKYLQESEARYKALHNASFGGITIHDKGIILDCNQGLSDISGFSVDELIGMDGLLLIAKDSRELVMNNILAGYENSYEAVGVRKNGEKYPLRLHGKTIPYKGIKARVVEFRDITELKKSENKLKSALEKATESDRLKSAFLANISHEIRTPMNGILGFSSLLKEPGLTGDQQQDYIGIIEDSGARMLNTISDIVDISRIEAGQLDVTISEVNINAKIESLHAFFKTEAEKKGMQLSFKNGLPGSESIIKTDREKLYSILTNLIKNAIKYSNVGSVEFGYEIVKTQNGESLQFYVKDTGIGIPKDRQEAIFERFVQADIEDRMAMQGSGLGLAISKAFAEMLGGNIWVESEVGVGSQFYFAIPFNSIHKKLKENKVEVGESQIKKLKILIADDEKTAQMFLTEVLKNIKKEILYAGTGLEALELCRNNSDIDLILMDIRMPDMHGYEATRKIREFNKGVVIIAQTAFGLLGDREKAIDAGCTDHISKPIKKGLLLELINKHKNGK